MAIASGPVRPGVVGVPDPVVILEVLSPSTAKHDRAIKLQDYRQIPSVHEIVLLSTEGIGAELWRRRGRGWMVADLRAGDDLALASVDIAIPLDSLYERIEFSAAS